MRRVREGGEGVWGLVWDAGAAGVGQGVGQGVGKGKGRVVGGVKKEEGVEHEGEVGEEEGRRRETRRVTEEGWGVLGWLIRFWEKDREIYGLKHPGQREYPSFVSPSLKTLPNCVSQLLTAPNAVNTITIQNLFLTCRE